MKPKLQPIELKALDPRPKVEPGYVGPAIIESYGMLLPVNKVTGVVCECTGRYQFIGGVTFAEVKQYSRVKFTKDGDYKVFVGHDPIKLPVDNLIKGNAEERFQSPSADMTKEQIIREETRLRLTGVLFEDCGLPVFNEVGDQWLSGDFYSDRTFGIIRIVTRRTNALPHVRYERFDKHGKGFILGGKMGRWDLPITLTDSEWAATLASVKKFITEQSIFVSDGLKEIWDLQNNRGAHQISRSTATIAARLGRRGIVTEAPNGSFQSSL